MSACLLVAGVALALAEPVFVLEWTHSVERTVWREHWLVTQDGLRLTEAAVKGSGAGMDPGEGAVLRDGWWVWQPALAPQAEVVLASSGATGSGWRLCIAGDCQTLGTASGAPVVLRPCPR